MKKNGKKKKILSFLREGEKTASEISGYLGINYYKILRLLNELEKEKSVIVITFRKKRYYKIIKSCFGSTKEFSKESGICKNCNIKKNCKKISENGTY